MKTYKVYRRRDAVCLMLGLESLQKRGVTPRKQDYYSFIDREIDEKDNDPAATVERIYYGLLSTGWRLVVGDVVELDGKYLFIDSVGVTELKGFELIE